MPTVRGAGSDAWHGVSGGLRKQPLQGRSKAAIQRILEVAESLIVDIGYEAVVGSPTLLLDETGVSRGSFYSFFESPERVLDELAFRHILKSAPAFRTAVTPSGDADWRFIVDGLMAFYIDQYRTPLVRELWVRQHLTQRVREIDRVWIEEASSDLQAAFRLYGPLFQDMTVTRCHVILHSLERLCQLAFRDDPAGDPDILAEARSMVESYFAANMTTPETQAGGASSATPSEVTLVVALPGSG